MNVYKKIIFSITAILVMSVSSIFVFACKKESTGTVIGISKFMQHPALDACEKGIMDALAERGHKVTYDLQNANADASTSSQIAEKFRSEKVAVAVGIATPVAQALANTIKNIPVVFTATTDPIGAGLVKSNENGEGNVTGASDKISTEENIAIFKEITNIKVLGYIYTPSEANSLAELELVKAGAAANDLELVTQMVNNSAEVKQAAQVIVKRVGGIYMSTDSTVFSALSAVIEVFNGAKKPIFAGDASGAMDGGCLIAKGSNYYRLGLSTGYIVSDILNGKKPADIPVKFATQSHELDFLIDLDNAALCGITIPQRYIDEASAIIENGVLTER
ncbi:MAG: ABC transporter substrate-binding protein [Termitinemataceae bacterium]|nr:MAG: ABC transporter substrate-binding protein [Termitinemataceae bacterium]